jgi:hypothetical protein
LRAERRDNFPLVTSGLCAEIELAPTVAIPAVAVAGLPRAAVDVANVLGLLPSQLAPTRDEALEAELDVPPGRWRVWPTRGVGLWVGRDTSPPPLARVRALYRLDLAETVRRLGEHGIWLYEGRVFDRGRWSEPLPLKPVYQLLLGGEATAVCGAFGDRAGRAHEAMIFRSGQLRMSHPEQALGWLEIACGLTDD